MSTSGTANENGTGRGARLRRGVMIVLCLLGLADSAYLTWDHASHKADPASFSGGLCGADGGCQISRASALSEVPVPGTPIDLPVSLVALSFYVVFLTLVWLRYRKEDEGGGATAIVRVIFGLSALSFAYSMVLFGYSLSLGSICKFCAILYGVNLGLLFVGWRELRAQGDAFITFFKGSLAAAISRPGMIAAIVMAAVTGGGYLAYRSLVGASLAASKSGHAPDKPGLTFKTEGRPTKGPSNATLHIVEFADFQCPHCRIAYQEIEAVTETRKDLAVTFLHFPLDLACNPLVTKPFHQNACDLAIIAECAHRQDRFFEVAPMLFDLGTEPIQTLMSRIDTALAGRIDMKALDACRTTKDAKNAVILDIGEGLKAKIQGTPSVFLNGHQIGGALPKADLERVLEERAPTSSK